MGFRTTVLLLGVVGLLVLLLFVTGEGPEGPAELSEPALGGRRVADTTRIVIDRRLAGQMMVLQRESDGWFYLVEPMRDLASAAVLRSLSSSYDTARLLEAYNAEEIAAQPRLLAETGVEPPRAKVRFEFADGEEVELDLGEEAPLGNDLFVRRGDTIYRAGLDLYSVLEHNVDDLRERQVFRQIPGEMKELLVRRALPDGESEILRLEQTSGRFTMTEPVQGRVDSNNLPVFVDRVFGMRAERFIPGVWRPPSEEPDLVLTIRGVAEERLEVWFQDDGTMLARVEDRQVACMLEGRLGKEFFTDVVQNLRAHFLVPVDIQGITAVLLDPGGDAPPAELRRDGGGFVLVSPVEAAANPSAVNEVMQGIRNLGVEEFVDGVRASDPAFGLDREFFTVGVFTQLRQTDPIRVRLGRDEGQQTYARRDDEEQVVKIPKAAADLLRQPWIGFVAPAVQRVTVPVAELRFVQGGDETAFLRGDDSRWRARLGGEPLPVVEELVEELVDLRARAALDPATVTLDVEPFAIQLLRASGDRLAELTVYDRGDPEQSLLVRKAGLDVLFELPVTLSRVIRELR